LEISLINGILIEKSTEQQTPSFYKPEDFLKQSEKKALSQGRDGLDVCRQTI